MIETPEAFDGRSACRRQLIIPLCMPMTAGEAVGTGVALYTRGLRLGLLYTPLSNPAGQPIQSQAQVLMQSRAGLNKVLRIWQQVKGVYFQP